MGGEGGRKLDKRLRREGRLDEDGWANRDEEEEEKGFLAYV